MSTTLAKLITTDENGVPAVLLRANDKYSIHALTEYMLSLGYDGHLYQREAAEEILKVFDEWRQENVNAVAARDPYEHFSNEIYSTMGPQKMGISVEVPENLMDLSNLTPYEKEIFDTALVIASEPLREYVAKAIGLILDGRKAALDDEDDEEIDE